MKDREGIKMRILIDPNNILTSIKSATHFTVFYNKDFDFYAGTRMFMSYSLYHEDGHVFHIDDSGEIFTHIYKDDISKDIMILLKEDSILYFEG